MARLGLLGYFVVDKVHFLCVGGVRSIFEHHLEIRLFHNYWEVDGQYMFLCMVDQHCYWVAIGVKLFQLRG